MMTNETSVKPIIEKLENLFAAINDRFYDGELTKPVITVSPDTKGYYGWCTAWKAWMDENDGYYEINLCAEYLSRPFEEVAETMMHEMVHLHNLQHGIKDTSRQGTYHNKNYKKAAEYHGLTVTKNDKYGWCETHLNDEGREFLQTFEDTKFELHRKALPKKVKATPKRQSKKYVCPICGSFVRSSDEVHIGCMDCMIVMVEAA